MVKQKRDPNVEYVQVTIRLPVETKKEIENRASKNVRSFTEEAEYLLRFALANSKAQAPEKTEI